MPLYIYQTVEVVISKQAEHFVSIATQAIKSSGRFTVALSGGSSPEKLYKQLASDFAESVNWSKVYFFFGDERYVPQEHADSNYRMVKNSLFDPLNINKGNIYSVNTTMTPDEAANDYQLRVEHFFAGQQIHFDLVLLGLGENVHTASLFPETEVLEDKLPGVKAVYLKDKHSYRITLNAPLINNAKQIDFLVYGSGKAEAVKTVIEGKRNTRLYPAQLIQPAEREPDWFLDVGAASKLALC